MRTMPASILCMGNNEVPRRGCTIILNDINVLLRFMLLY